MIIRYDLPLTEVVYGFYDRMKSVSRGYASLDYEPKGYRDGRSGAPGPAGQRRAGRLTCPLIVHRETAFYKGRELCDKMKELIPMQQFEVAIQAAIGSKIIARTTVKACARTSPPSVTAVTSAASASCWSARRKVRRG